MQTFANELRRSREERKISLEQVAEATLINIRFLEAIERGDMSMLPQAYVRAFIREYASVIGLDQGDVMKRYDEALAGKAVERQARPEPEAPQEREVLPAQEAPQEPEAPPEPPPPSPRELTEERPAETGSPEARPRIARYVAVTVALAAIAALVAVFWNRNGTPPPGEVPFQDVVRENEARIAPPTPASQTPPAQPAPADSLALTASITDSVWVQLTIDAGAPQEFLFGAGRKRSWKAKEKFVVTLGNAGAVQFTLNGISLGTLGKPGAVIRNAEISRAQLERR